MKKTICMLLAVLSLVAVFMMPISAAITYKSAVLEDLATLTIDGEPFEAANYPRDFEDDNMYLITVVEQTFNPNSESGYELYFFIYNPSCMYVNDDAYNSIVIGTQVEFEADDKAYEGDGYHHYHIEFCSRSSDDRFLKFRVSDEKGGRPKTKTDLYNQVKGFRRIYHISGIHLKVGGQIRDFSLGVTYEFKGYKDDSNYPLTCTDQKLQIHEVTLHPTSWISPNAGTTISGRKADKFDHYEVSSVYFRLPRKIFSDGYNNIYGFRAEFEKYHLTPMIVTHDKRFITAEGNSDADRYTGTETRHRIVNGLYLNQWEPGAGSLDLVANIQTDADWWKPLVVWLTDFTGDWVFSDDDSVRSEVTNDGGKSYDRLGWYFSVDKFENIDFDDFEDPNYDYGLLAVDSVRLRQTVIDQLARTDPEHANHIDASVLYTNDPDEVDCDEVFTAGSRPYTLVNYMSSLSDFQKRLQKWIYDDQSYIFDEYASSEVPPFVVLGTDNPNSVDFNESLDFWLSQSDETISKMLYIGRNDVATFRQECAAAGKDEIVVILHIGVKDYRCAPLYEVNEALSQIGATCVGFAVDKWVYLNVNVTEALVTSTDGRVRSVPLVSNTVDIVGSIIVFPNPNDDNGFFPDDPKVLDNIWNVLKWILIILLVIVLLPVLIWVLGKIFGFLGKSVDSAQEQIERSKRRREEREAKKKEKEAKKNDKKSE